MAAKAEPRFKIVAENRKARFNYEIGEKFEAGIALTGSEVKSLRSGKAAIAESYADARRGDFLYFDPPYDPVAPTANFTSYTADAFGPDEQRALAETARELVSRGCHVMLSNSDTPFIRSIYKGFTVERVKCPRAINSNAAKRGDVDELIITGC